MTAILTDESHTIAPPSASDGRMPPTCDLSDGRPVSDAAVRQFEADGVVCLRNVIDAPTIDALRDEADHAVANPSPEARFVKTADNPGMFYYEFDLWTRYPVLERVLFESRIADVAMSLMRSNAVSLHYTNTFVKDGGATTTPTPWHEDASYHRITGRNAIALFLAYDRMPAETTLKFKQASHLKPDPIYMGSTFNKGVEYGAWMEDHIPMPSQAELDRRFRTVYWAVEPGDVLAFTQRTLHAGPANTLPTRRHATSFNVIGDGARYDARPGPVDAPGGLDPDLPHGSIPRGARFPALRGQLS